MDAIWTSRTFFALNARLMGRVGESLALAALPILAGAALFKVSYANAALGFLLAATLLNAPDVWHRLRREPLFWCALLYIAYVLTYALLLPPPLPDEAASPLRVTGHYIKGAFLPALLVGYWLHRRPELVVPILFLLPAGLLARVLVRLEPGDVERLTSGAMRATFGDSAVHFGIWSVIVVLCGVWALTRALLQHGIRVRGWPPVFYGLLLITAGMTGVLLSHTRTAWGLTLMMVPAFWLLLILPSTVRRYRPIAAMAVIGTVIGVMAIAWWALPELLQARWEQMQDALAVAFSGSWANAPLDSPGYRLHMWREAWLAWMQRPALGWGPGSEVIFLSNPQEPAIAKFHQFHNSLLTVLVELGVAGGVFFLLAFAIPCCYAARVWWSGHPQRDAVLLALFCVLTMLGAAMSDNVISSYRGPFLIALFAGIALAAQLDARRDQGRAARVERHE